MKMLPLALVVATSACHGAIIVIPVSLDGSQEVSPVTTTGTGTATVTVDDVLNTVEIMGSYTSMQSTVTMAHLHGFTGPDSNAGVLFGLTISGGTDGTFSSPAVSRSAADIQQILAGQSYINVHSSGVPSGEIRGQVVPTPVPEPSTLLLVAGGMIGLLKRRRS